MPFSQGDMGLGAYGKKLLFSFFDSIQGAYGTFPPLNVL